MMVGTAITSRLEARFASELAGVSDAQLVRRCADVEELLTAAESGAITVAAVSPDFPGISGSAIAELTLRGTSVLGVTSATSPLDERQCEAWGLRQTHVVGSGRLDAELRALLTRTGAGEPGVAGDLVSGAGDGGARDGSAPGVSDPSLGEGEGPQAPEARIVMVWGPQGAPGRTTCATHLSRELAPSGPTLLIDADTTASACGAHLGLLDEAPGVLAAARLVDAGTFNRHQLRSIAAHVDEGFDVLTGIGNPNRWPELTRFHLARILEVAAQHYRWVVVDVAADLSADESLLFDTLAPARNGASLEVAERADVIVALAAADPVSLQRFVQAGAPVLAAYEDVRVVIARARDTAVGGPAGTVVAQALERFVGARPVAVLPDVRDALDDAMLRGGLVCADGKGGPYVEAVRVLAADLGATLVPGGSARGRWLRRRR